MTMPVGCRQIAEFFVNFLDAVDPPLRIVDATPALWNSGKLSKGRRLVSTHLLSKRNGLCRPPHRREGGPKSSIAKQVGSSNGTRLAPNSVPDHADVSLAQPLPVPKNDPTRDPLTRSRAAGR